MGKQGGRQDKRTRGACRFMFAGMFFMGVLPANVLAAGDTSSIQDPTEVAVDGDQKTVELRQVTVTAQRRVDQLQDVPIAVTAFDAVELDRRQITSAFDLAQNVPNLYGTKTTGPASGIEWFLRGVGSVEISPTIDVPVGTYVDDIYIARQSANQLELLDVQRIEVLRGPQGVQFGRNTTGGAIHMITRKPLSSPRIAASMSVGSHGLKRLRATVDGPLSDNSAGQFAVFRAKSDGWLKSLVTGDSYNGQDDWGARGAVLLQPADGVMWDLSATYTNADAIGLGSASVPGTRDAVSGSLGEAYTDLRNCRGSEDLVTAVIDDKCAFNRTESLLLASNIEWAFGGVTLNAITGYYGLSQQYAFDLYDNNPLLGNPHFDVANDGRTHQFSQEFKLNGQGLGGRLKYVSGLYYLNERNTTGMWDLYGEGDFRMVIAERTPVRNKTVSIAAYTQADYSLTEKATLQLGARLTDEEKKFAVRGIDVTGIPFSAERLDEAGVPRQLNITKWTPKAALQYEWNPGLMTYVSATSGFKSGGWNGRGTTPETMAAFNPETVRSFEAGMRSEWWDKRFRLNATAFHVRYKDLQLVSAIGSDFVTTNAGNSQTYGLEFESSLQATSRLRFDGSLGLQRAKYLRLSPSAMAYGIGPDPVNTPKVSAQVIADYVLSQEVAGGTVSVGGSAHYQGEFYQGSTNDPVTLVDSHALFNAQVNWKQNSGPWGVRVGCTNCSDVSWFSTNLIGVLYGREPRMWTLQVSYLMD